jgi:hypothetical protein
MRITVKTGIISAAIWILIKLSFFYLDISRDSIVPLILLNILGLLVSIAIGLFLQKMRDTEETNLILDVKNGMTAGLPYTIIVSVFIYFYYSKINPEYYAHQIAEKEIAIEKMVNNPVELRKFKAEQKEAEVMTKEAIEKKLKENNRNNIAVNPGITAVFSVLSLLLLTIFYSFLVTIIYRQVIFKQR